MEDSKFYFLYFLIFIFLQESSEPNVFLILNANTVIWKTWMHCCNLQSSWEDEETHKVYSCVDLYFVSQVSFSNFIVFQLLKNLTANPYFIVTSLILQIV